MKLKYYRNSELKKGVKYLQKSSQGFHIVEMELNPKDGQLYSTCPLELKGCSTLLIELDEIKEIECNISGNKLKGIVKNNVLNSLGIYFNTQGLNFTLPYWHEVKTMVELEDFVPDWYQPYNCYVKPRRDELES